MMSLPRFEPFTPVTLSWEDANHETAAQYDSCSLALGDYEPAIRKTIGFYVGEARKRGRRCVVICTDDDREKDDDERVGGPFYCPIGMVVKITPIGTTKRKRR